MLKTTDGDFINPRYIKRVRPVTENQNLIWIEGQEEDSPNTVEGNTKEILDAIDGANGGNNVARLSELVSTFSRRVTDLIQAINRIPSSIRVHY